MRLAGIEPPPVQWILPPALPESIAARFPRACRPALQALYNRRILDETPESTARLQEFMNLALADPDPFTFADMDRAVERILRELRTGRPIGVFGHFDCDGVTATALLSEALRCLGAIAIPFIPSREDEYGIPETGLRCLAEQGVKLVVTVDCGIKAMNHVLAARALGMDVVITDHHHCEQIVDGSGRICDVLPDAAAVVNPKRQDCPYPYKQLAGVGMAFRLAQALAAASGNASGDSGGLTADRLDSFLDLVCVGTVGDVMELTGENRRLVARGLAVLRQLQRPGFRSLAGVSRIAADRLTARSIAFSLAPRLNAAQRLKHGQLALDLLMAGSFEEAAPLATELEELNRLRRDMTDRAVEAACAVLEDRVESHQVLVAPGQWISGISGLVASRLKETFGKPALAIRDANGAPAGAAERAAETILDPAAACVGSARSVPGFDITEALSHSQDLLVAFGGHSGAAGFTVLRGDIPALEHELNDFASRYLLPDLVGPRLYIDAVLTREELTAELGRQVERFEPCGQGNPALLFLLPQAAAVRGSVRTYNDGGFSFQVNTPGRPVRVSGSGVDLARALEAGRPVDLVCTVGIDSRATGAVTLRMVDGRVGRGLMESVVTGPLSPALTTKELSSAEAATASSAGGKAGASTGTSTGPRTGAASGATVESLTRE